MKLPNKLYSYSESILSKMPPVLSALQQQPYGVYELYRTVPAGLAGIGEYMELLDCLYALNKIRYDEEKEVLTYVVGDDEP